MMKKFADVILGFILTVALLAVLSYFVRDVWNIAIVPIFHAREMTLASSAGILSLIWVASRVAADAFVATITSKLTMFLQESMRMNPPVKKTQEEKDEI
jgi:hypothetical protein